MNDLLTELEKAGQLHRGTRLGGTLQWAILKLTALNTECEILRERATRAEDTLHKVKEFANQFEVVSMKLRGQREIED